MRHHNCCEGRRFCATGIWKIERAEGFHGTSYANVQGGKLKIRGNMMLATKLDAVLKDLAPKAKL